MMNALFINKKIWNNFTEHELDKYSEDVFQYYRSSGFPYFPVEHDWRRKEYARADKYEFKKCIDREAKVIKQTMHGLALCWSYHPHHYEIQCNKMFTVAEAFRDDDMLRRVIKKRIKMGDNMSDNGLRKMLKIFSGVQCVSNFRPTAAAAIYSLFCDKGDTVYDMSAGFGGRALGANLAGMKYLAVDPSTKAYTGVCQMAEDFGMDANVFKQGSECNLPAEESSVDLCFTSPPYFDCEKYSDEETQSYIKYPSKYLWLNGFLRDTLIECKRVLKPDKYIVLNVQSVKSYKNLVDDVKNLAGELGLVQVDEWGLQLSSLAGGGYKTEPILVFKDE